MDLPIFAIFAFTIPVASPFPNGFLASLEFSSGISTYEDSMSRWAELIGDKMLRPANARKVKELKKRR